jgi:putative SOS response-associated peptidase YedK
LSKSESYTPGIEGSQSACGLSYQAGVIQLFPMATLATASVDDKYGRIKVSYVVGMCHGGSSNHAAARQAGIVPRDDYDGWLESDELGQPIHLYTVDLECYPVSTFVNHLRNDDPHCIGQV